MSKPLLGWFVVCERASIDADTNAITLTDCAEAFVAEVFPCTVPRLCCVAYFHREEPDRAKSLPCRVVVEPPGRPEVVVVEGSADFEAGHRRNRTRFFLDSFTFKTVGRYVFRLDVKRSGRWVTEARLPIDAAAFVETEV